tara:strand:+ start:94 stop:549 length:456 start_codon:yes stop_codon:yes gene_type:complete
MSPKSSATKEASQPVTYAIVETSGSQFWLETNRYYDLNRFKANIDQTITLDKVLLINDGKSTKLGEPYIPDAKVEVKVLEHRRGPKILVYKMRPKKKTRRKNGHRQELTRVLVKSISIEGKTSTKATSKTTTKATKNTKAKKSDNAKEQVK